MVEIFFDIGGTLVESPDFFEELILLFPEEKISKEELMKVFQENYLLAMKDFKQVRNVIVDTLKKLISPEKVTFEKIGSFYSDLFLTRSKLYGDVIPTLEALKKAGATLHVISDADADVLYGELKYFDIKKYFKEIFISGEMGAYKDSSEAIGIVSKKVELVDKCNTYVVGDSNVDINFGKRMEIKTIHLNRNHGKSYDSDYEIHDLGELADIALK